MSGNELQDRVTNLLIILLLVFTGFFSILIVDSSIDISGARAQTIIVDCNGGGNFFKIQEAIENASAGDTIIVKAGEYYERINITKKLDIIGNGCNNTIIDGSLDNTVIISANRVNFSGFLITGSGKSWIWGDLYSGIKLQNVENCNIKF